MSHLVPRVDAHAEGLWGSGLVSSHSKYDYTNLHTIHEHLLTYCKDRSHLDLQYLRVNGGHSVLPSDLPVDYFPKDTHCSLIPLELLFHVQLLLATDNFLMKSVIIGGVIFTNIFLKVIFFDQDLSFSVVGIQLVFRIIPE